MNWDLLADLRAVRLSPKTFHEQHDQHVAVAKAAWRALWAALPHLGTRK
jgi:hypothetical protein